MLTLLADYIERWYTCPKTVTHPSTNWARHGLTSFMRRTPLTTTPRWYTRPKMVTRNSTKWAQLSVTLLICPMMLPLCDLFVRCVHDSDRASASKLRFDWTFRCMPSLRGPIHYIPMSFPMCGRWKRKSSE